MTDRERERKETGFIERELLGEVMGGTEREVRGGYREGESESNWKR